jgi:hypothetical protein
MYLSRVWYKSRHFILVRGDFYEILDYWSHASSQFRSFPGGSMLAGSGIIEANRGLVELEGQ